MNEKSDYAIQLEKRAHTLFDIYRRRDKSAHINYYVEGWKKTVNRKSENDAEEKEKEIAVTFNWHLIQVHY